MYIYLIKTLKTYHNLLEC